MPLCVERTVSLEILHRTSADKNYLELLSGVLIVSSIVVHQIDKLEVVSLPAFVIVRVVSRGDLDGTSSEGHVDGDTIGNDGEPTVDERMLDILSNEVLEAREIMSGYGTLAQVIKAYFVSFVIWVNGDGGVSEQSLQTSGSDNNPLIGIFNLVCERSDCTKLELLLDIVSWDIQEGLALQLLLIDLRKQRQA